MDMGWWKPYFFMDPNGVQFLLPGLVIDGIYELLCVSGLIALLSLLDRYASHNARKRHPESSLFVSTLWYTLQKFTSGLLMLVMMSFNGLLFLEVVLFGGLAEFGIKLQSPIKNEGTSSTRFQRVLTSEIEMEDC